MIDALERIVAKGVRNSWDAIETKFDASSCNFFSLKSDSVSFKVRFLTFNSSSRSPMICFVISMNVECRLCLSVLNFITA